MLNRIDALLEGLNENQKRAATAMDGKYLVLASAGSGKTRVLTHRIAYLIELGVQPWEIVGISFTKKASNEIKERVAKLIGEKALDVNMGTFHSLCMRILIRHQEALGMSNMTILDDTEAKKIISDIAVTFGYMSEDAVYEIKNSIDRWGNEGWTAEQVKQQGNNPEDIVNIYEEYSSFKRSVGYVDFNDILSLTHELFRFRPDILQQYSSKYKYLIVDESQDLNNIQFKLVQQLSSHHQNFMLIGDDLQSIYAFRGSKVDNIMNIRQFDAQVQTILLEQNYRSSQSIVKASNALIANNVNQMEKISYTENGEGSPVFIYDSIDETKEADFVVSVIEGLVKNKGMQYDDFAVLYRANYLSRNIELAFSSVGIPYEIVGGSEFYERDEIKTLVCYLRALDNEMDDLAHERILNKPKRGIGATTVNRISMYAAENNVSFFKALQHIEDIPKINKPTKGRILEFVDLLNQAKEMLRKPDATVLGLLKYMMIQTDFMAQYDVYKTEDLTRIQNIEELWNVAAQFDNKPKEELAENQTIVTQFLTETALYVQDDDPDARARVSLTTVHSSKGLEFKCVFVIGLQAGVFPSYLSTQQDDLEEERRLFYVAMTRAKEMLFLSFNRYKYNGGQKQEVQPSRFLKEIPEEYTRYLGQKNW